jgi:lactobin A/cerein 7B family class IIb bacteriocin
MKDINESELHAIDGGVAPWLVPMLAGAALASILNGWADFKQGFVQGYRNQTGEVPI